ncbi:hypothetical protein Q1695_003263 [Nippostrongylus brasiliensis]|nr:hypothetical protein Q1695_003263 [Nippostrongylus brasiliensis]
MRAFGALKRQFLSLHTELQYDLESAAKIINAAVCLWDLCIAISEHEFTEESNADFEDASNETAEMTVRKGRMAVCANQS